MDLRGIAVVALVASVGCVSRERPHERQATAAPAPPGAAEPRSFESRGRLVCLAEEMRERHGANVPPVHAHVVGLRVEGAPGQGSPGYVTILETASSRALFKDPRFAGKDLVVAGRVFPESALLEVTRLRWIEAGVIHDLSYWCDVCSIRSLDPGACACCQGEVEFRTRPVDSPR